MNILPVHCSTFYMFIVQPTQDYDSNEPSIAITKFHLTVKSSVAPCFDEVTNHIFNSAMLYKIHSVNLNAVGK